MTEPPMRESDRPEAESDEVMTRRRRWVSGLGLGLIVPLIGLLWWAGIASSLVEGTGGDLSIGFVVYGFFGLTVGLPLLTAIALTCLRRTRDIGLGMFAGLAIAAMISPGVCATLFG